MAVKVVAVTRPLGDGPQTAEELIAYAARVSNPANQNNHVTSAKLLRYCIAHKHWSVFETASMTVEITTSRAIATQLLRHRSFQFQEFSQRYATSSAYIEYPARRQDTKNRQNSIDDMSDDDKAFFARAQQTVWDQSYQLYREALDRGIAREQARFLLPLNTQTTLYMTGTVRSWIHYLDVRCDPSTQKEHRDIAGEIRVCFAKHFPETARALWGA
ncbi:hypothetical protein GGF32_003818 [Allomyces javanicus]|nr:hypothetical protein GGF32_003818 [Allomyces javanicus]